MGAFPSYGYIKNPEDNHKLIIDNESAEIVRKIFEWKVNEGLGNLSICHRLNDMGVLNPTGYKKKRLNQNYNNSKILQEDYSWCPSTVRNILKNDIYIGNVTQGKRRVKSYKVHKVEQVPEDEWITVENMHEAIIDKELFEKAQGMGKVDTRVQNSGNLSMWAGILKCADCGRAMHKKYCKNKSGTVYEYYICGTYRKKSNKLCTKHTLKVEELENAVLETIKIQIGLISDIDRIKKEIDDGGFLEKRKHFLEENINKCEEFANIRRKLRKEAYEDWKLGNITEKEYNDYTKEYGEQIRQSEDTIDKYYEELKEFDQASRESSWIEYFTKYKNVNSLSRGLIDSLVDNIYIYEDKKIKIKFKYEDEYNYLMDFIKRRKNFLS